jgi:hypothetical protein
MKKYLKIMGNSHPIPIPKPSPTPCLDPVQNADESPVFKYLIFAWTRTFEHKIPSEVAAMSRQSLSLSSLNLVKTSRQHITLSFQD